jgi:hypothetical protein
MKRSLALLPLIFGLLIPKYVDALPVTTPVCTKSDVSFQNFLRQFQNDASFRRGRLQLPLVVRTGDGISVDATIELWPLPKVLSLKGPLIYAGADLKKYGLAETILLLQPSRYAEVLQANAGAADDTKLIYRFRNRDGCWFLEGFDDMGE